MTSTILRSVLLLLCLVGLSAAALGEDDADKAATPVEHAEPLPKPEPGVLGTRGYKPSQAEAPFHERLDKAERVTGGFFSDYGITGKKGIFVGWFGIVRKVTEDKAKNRTELLVEMKYFDGLTELHLQLVSINGAGDFRVRLTGTGLGIKHLSLVKAYGIVESETDSIPLLAAEFARHWDWGLFTFMNYGKPKGNQEWRELLKVPVDRIYSPAPDDRYYEARLGERNLEVEAAGIATPEELARTVFDALKGGDVKLLEPVVVQVADVEWTLAHFEKREKTPGEARRSLEKQGGAKKLAVKSRTSLEDSYKVVREAVPDWSDAQFGGLVDEETDIADREGVQAGSVVFKFTAGDVIHRVVLKGAGRVGRGWIITKRIEFLD